MSIKPLKYKELDGLSAKQLAEHHDVLYAGYVKKYSEIEKKLKNVDLTQANGTYSDLRELNVEKTFALNGVKLHEAYFSGMVNKDSNPAGKIAELIKRDFSSIEDWQNQFKALGLAARGWIVLAYDLDDKKLSNYVCDAHNQGGVWNCVALIILDVYEHAYFLDYATGRKDYIEAYMQNINWNEINSRIEKYNLS
ncbi:MAG: Fe-Mn family superoxide dismutase [bacterium]|nr:Fe-Mn family superoxide dismutase [bacterium]